ncbi:hypothetical protein WJX73_000401 [Symbiochloris irregularis]|uniref:Uncharacterized protein n=1 Tax=Symbiochloris irregularis TaxID=706552 RepID=A0AAW1PUK2_9CHLO
MDKGQTDQEYQEYPHLSCCINLHAEDLFKNNHFTESDWHKHKSWTRHFIAAPFLVTQVLAWYWPPVLVMTLIAVVASMYHEFAEPAGAPNVSGHNLTYPFTFTSFALSLLLVFRTNSAYTRWWEARTQIGGLLAISRTLARQVLAWTDAKDVRDWEVAQSVVRWSIMLPFAVQSHLLVPGDIMEDAQDVLSKDEREWLKACPHLPIAVSQVISCKLTGLQCCRASSIRHTTLEMQLTLYQQTVAACERLLRQPVPIAYTRHTSRFLLTWLMFLPWSLWATCQWLTIPITAIITFLLIGIENIGVQIEQPFAVLPVASISNTIKANLMQMLVSASATRRLALPELHTCSPLGFTAHDEKQ